MLVRSFLSDALIHLTQSELFIMKYFAIIWLLLNAGHVISQTAYYTNLAAQLNSSYGLTGGTWVLAADESQVLNSLVGYGGTLKGLTSVSGQPFTRYQQIAVPMAGDQPWSSGIYCRNTKSVNKGSIALLVIWLRSTSGSAKVNIYVEHATTFDKELFITTEIGTKWQQFIAPFDANNNYLSGELTIGLHTGFKAQTIQIGGIALSDFKMAYAFDQFPAQLHQTYAGSETNASWKAEADQNIERFRKGDFKVLVRHPNGTPVSGAKVKFEMLEHEFKFGSAITANRIANNHQQNKTYEQKIVNFDGKGHGFNEVVFENDLKWDAWEEEWFASNQEVVQATNWLVGKGISVRGHTLIWPGWQYMPDDLEKNKNNPGYLKNRVLERVTSILNYPGIKGNIKEWDALNEITYNEDLAKALAGSPGYPTGREIYIDILKKVKEIDPNIRIFINDYTTIDQGNLPGSPIFERTKQYLQEIQRAGIKIDGVGFQGHISSGLVSIYDVKKTLDDFYTTFGTRAKITEFDYGNLVSDSLAARFTADFFTICFSHPSVDGFLSWGFWQGAHWLNNAPFFRVDWTMRPAGLAVADLLFNKWWTNTTVTTTSAGEAKLRGFKGKYRITVTNNGQVSYIDTVDLSHGSNLEATLSTSVGIAEIHPLANSLKFVNPAPHATDIQINCSVPINDLQLYSLDGKLINQIRKPGQVFIITTPPSPGVYVIKFSPQGFSELSKILIVR